MNRNAVLRLKVRRERDRRRVYQQRASHASSSKLSADVVTSTSCVDKGAFVLVAVRIGLFRPHESA